VAAEAVPDVLHGSDGVVLLDKVDEAALEFV
jgi:hypothetical protein